MEREVFMSKGEEGEKGKKAKRKADGRPQ